MKIVIPIAGRGKRFLDQASTHPEYSVPKPVITIKGFPMVQWSLATYYPYIQRTEAEKEKPLKFSDFIFVCLKEHEEKFSISKTLKKAISKEINCVFIPGFTRGAAETALAAREFIDNDEGLVISDSDSFSYGKSFVEAILNDEEDYFGTLPITTPADIPTWSYVVREGGYVTRVAEKDVELFKSGAPGILGHYHFKKGKNFVEECLSMIEENDMGGPEGRKEFYMSQVYTRAIKKGKKVKWVWVNKQWCLGTPELVDVFLKTSTEKDPFACI